MALFVVRPSRGTVAFFALLTAALALRTAWERHERRLVAVDAPPAHTTRRLLRCLLGRDAERVLGPRAAAGERSLVWARRITERLVRVPLETFDGAWPRRCAPIADRLATRLDRRAEGFASAGPHARAVAAMLHEAARSPRAALEQFERGELGMRLAALAFATSGVSSGAQEGWQAPLPYAPTDLALPYVVFPPRSARVAPAPAHAMLLGPDAVLYRDAREGRLRLATFGPDERLRDDVAVGRGAPVRGAWRVPGATRVAADAGDAVYLHAAGALVPAPRPVREGREGAHDWDVAHGATRRYLLTDDGGTLRVRVAPLGPPWEPFPDAPIATLGGPDVMVGGALAPDPADPDAVRVLALRRGLAGPSLEVYVLPAPTAAAPAPPPAPRELLGEWPAYDPRATSCAAGAVRYLLVRAATAASVVRVEGDAATRIEVGYGAMGTPSGGRFELSCDARRALLFADTTPRGPALVAFDFGAREATVFAPPQLAPDAAFRGGVLRADGALLAVVEAHGLVHTVRAFYTRDRGASWEGGALLALLGDGESFAVAQLAAEGSRVAMLAEARTARGTAVVRLGSRDGRTFRGGP